MTKALYLYKETATTASRQLGYPESVREAIRNATTESEIARIMKSAREKGVQISTCRGKNWAKMA